MSIGVYLLPEVVSIHFQTIWTCLWGPVWVLEAPEVDGEGAGVPCLSIWLSPWLEISLVLTLCLPLWPLELIRDVFLCVPLPLDDTWFGCWGSDDSEGRWVVRESGMMSEEDGDDAGIAPESSSSLSFSGASFFCQKNLYKKWKLYSTFLYHKIDLITEWLFEQEVSAMCRDTIFWHTDLASVQCYYIALRHILSINNLWLYIIT